MLSSYPVLRVENYAATLMRIIVYTLNSTSLENLCLPSHLRTGVFMQISQSLVTLP